MSRLNAANNAQSLLDGGISDTDVSMTVLDGSVFPEPPFLVTIEDEIIEVGAKSGNVFSSLLRGREGTVAVAHASGIEVQNRMTVGMYDSLALQEDVTDLAGTGRTIETVKGNADDLAAHLADTAQKHITESGSNANGNYIKFDDGTQICTSPFIDISGAATTALGNIFYYPLPYQTYPASFISVPTTTVNVYRNGGNYAGSLGWGSAETKGTTTGITPVALKPATGKFENTLVSIVAIGRWKA